ncbi:MAG: hypothetical protein C1O27_001304 [Chloroflexi bacterium]|nr:MAG: hypothetical protein C1O27_001304 [Chloroflexota bacterium]
MIERPIQAGLFSGAIAAIVASLVQLPLYAPSDTLFNSATVTAGALAAGLAAGVLWKVTNRRANRVFLFGVAWGVVFAATVVFSAIGETQLNRSISFIVPLAAVVLGLTGVGTPLLASSTLMRRWAVPLAAVVVAIGVGIGLVGQGDAESGRLELPPRSAEAPIVAAI